MNRPTAVSHHGRLTNLKVKMQFVEATNPDPHFLTSTQIRDWNERGYILDLPVLDASELASAREFFGGLDRNSDPAEKFKFNTHARNPFGYNLVRHPRTLGYLQDLIGPDVVCFISEYINKAPGSPTANHGHQDCVFNAMDVGCAIVWLALDDADEGNGCMRFVPGSHKMGVLECREDFALADVSSFKDWVPARVKAGHCVIMSDILIHSSPNNPSEARYRPGFTATYASARTPLLVEHKAEPILCCGQNVNSGWKIRQQPQHG